MQVHPANLQISEMVPRVLLIDNHDSFTWNLARLMEETRLCKLAVKFIDEIEPEQLNIYDKFIFSPGPGIPAEYPLMKEMIQVYGPVKSILGICLGHQAIVEAMGGSLIHLDKVVHGMRQLVEVLDPGEILFHGLPSSFNAGLYHSWAADSLCIPECLRVTASGPGGVVMGISHKTIDIKGLQFHPESYMTEFGHQIIANWLKY